MSVADVRTPPFCYQTHAALAAIRAAVTGSTLAPVLGVYLALTERANSGGGAAARNGFSCARKELAALAGVSVKTLDRHVATLEQAGVLVVEHGTSEAGSPVPNRWILVDPPGVKIVPTLASNTTRKALEEEQPLEVLRLDLGLEGEEGPREEGRRPRPRDLAFEALCEATGFAPETGRDRLNKALSGIRKLFAVEMPAANDEDLAQQIRVRAAYLKHEWDGRPVSPQALATWWKPAGEKLADVQFVVDALGELPEDYDPEPEATRRFNELQELRRPSGRG